jgi:1-acyl-sn-glycerol-3-phosphate acyltransferase
LSVSTGNGTRGVACSFRHRLDFGRAIVAQRHPYPPQVVSDIPLPVDAGPNAKQKNTPHFHPHPEGRHAVKLFKLINGLYARIYHDLCVLAPPKLPDTGAAILISNHTSSLDPLMIQSVLHRVVVWMMAKEYYEIPALNPFFRLIEAIPVERGSRDTSAMRAALRALQEGRILGVFPEGQIETTRELLPFQPGVAQMAIKLKVPVFPCYLDGTQRGMEMGQAFVRRNAASIRFGSEIQIGRSSTSHEALEAATARLRAAMDSLKNQTQHRTFR